MVDADPHFRFYR